MKDLNTIKITAVMSNDVMKDLNTIVCLCTDGQF